MCDTGGNCSSWNVKHFSPASSLSCVRICCSLFGEYLFDSGGFHWTKWAILKTWPWLLGKCNVNFTILRHFMEELSFKLRLAPCQPKALCSVGVSLGRRSLLNIFQILFKASQLPFVWVWRFDCALWLKKRAFVMFAVASDINVNILYNHLNQRHHTEPDTSDRRNHHF